MFQHNQYNNLKWCIDTSVIHIKIKGFFSGGGGGDLCKTAPIIQTFYIHYWESAEKYSDLFREYSNKAHQ